MADFTHETVLLDETVSGLNPHSNGRYIDCTLGGGGHTERLLAQSGPEGRVLALDQDPNALQCAKARIAAYGDRCVVARANFREIARIAAEHAFTAVDGILFDLGVSSPQFDVSERGFSYRMDGPLDMRMDPEGAGWTAADFVNQADEAELAKIFFEYGEEKFSRRIARAVAEQRQIKPIVTTLELADIVKEAIPAATRRTGPHPARRVFQALRIAVNDELNVLEAALQDAFGLLKPGGRLAVISFHSLEDRIVKTTFAGWNTGCTCPPDFPVCQCGKQPVGRLITRKPISPGEDELLRNPRARSAKLRVIERLQEQVS